MSNPLVPVEVGSIDTPGIARAVAVSGNFAYVADSNYGLRVIDVSVPTLPIEVGFYDTPGVAYRVAIAGDYAYVADSWRGIRAVDISIPTAPVSVGFYDTPGSASNGVVASGGFVWLAEGSAGFEVFRDCEFDLLVDGFESGDTSAWSSTVP